MRYYVTLFDSNYLTRGLVMYHSLRKHSESFHLWVICFDDLAHKILTDLKLEHLTLVSLAQFEDKELLRIKSERSQKEYCWTCTPSTALYVMNTEPHVDAVTYLDADLMFFSSPEPIFAEDQNASILLTEHRYLPEIKQSAISSGIYNVQFVTFKRNEQGLAALNWWRERCLEWCFARAEDNKFGDQKYLDDWTTRFTGVHVVEHLGAGLAPWNVLQYQIESIDRELFVNKIPVIFYHFHAFKIHPFNIGYSCTYYEIDRAISQWIYQAYFQEIQKAYQQVRHNIPAFRGGLVDLPKVPKNPIALSKLIEQVIIDIQKGKYFYCA
jgi:hypothetical protein